MSRVGRKPVEIPDKVKVIQNGCTLEVSGPLGSLNTTIPEGITVAIEDKVANVGKAPVSRASAGYQGLVRALLANMVEGVTKGYERKLEISGVGYKAEQQGNKLTLSLGYSHQIVYELPKGIEAQVEKATQITLKGIDKQVIGQAAAQIRGYKLAEPYKGKGVKYAGEQIRRKVGKTGAK